MKLREKLFLIALPIVFLFVGAGTPPPKDEYFLIPGLVLIPIEIAYAVLKIKSPHERTYHVILGVGVFVVLIFSILFPLVSFALLLIAVIMSPFFGGYLLLKKNGVI